MSVFYHEDPPPNSSKISKFLSAALKDAFCNCHNFGGRLPTAVREEEYPTSDFDDEQEVVVSAIRSGAMEKLRHRPSLLTDSFSWVYYPRTGELYMTPKAAKGKENYDGDEDEDDDDDEREEFVSAASYFSCCSSAMSREAFYSVKTNFSRSSSLNGIDLPEFWRRSIIQELCHCEGWPFGLCRKAVLLPPLPKSPSESWSWRKGTRILKMP
ncbi:uncharacterized protein LOC108987614 [Juglans regia]|uniref:Uncharacterized protein LOC108987614 n=2 Tax=Juglans regia TaxID=51240 RepID=A0A2I4E9L7_JUGRE|nr:uncharacterized protein LOC108987614 [Juglans regia]